MVQSGKINEGKTVGEDKNNDHTIEFDGDEEVVEPKQTEQKPVKQKKSVPKWMWVFLVVVLLAAVGYGVYYWQQTKVDEQVNKVNGLTAINGALMEENAKLTKQLKSAKSAAAETSASSPSAADLENIKAAITSGNTAALEGYMADKVTVIIAASEGLGTRTPAQAISDLDYVSDGTSPWDFALSSATISGWASGDYASYISSDGLIGKSANNYVVAFKFDSAGKISTIFMTNNASLL